MASSSTTPSNGSPSRTPPARIPLAIRPSATATPIPTRPTSSSSGSPAPLHTLSQPSDYFSISGNDTNDPRYSTNRLHREVMVYAEPSSSAYPDLASPMAAIESTSAPCDSPTIPPLLMDIDTDDSPNFTRSNPPSPPPSRSTNTRPATPSAEDLQTQQDLVRVVVPFLARLEHMKEELEDFLSASAGILDEGWWLDRCVLDEVNDRLENMLYRHWDATEEVWADVQCLRGTLGD